MDIWVSELKQDKISDYRKLIIEVYDEFVAPDYPEEGNSSFYSFMTEEALRRRMGEGSLTVYAAVGDEPAGACAFRDGTHLAVFFVKRKYQGKGIGRMMFAYSLRKLRKEFPEAEKITVNSSPFALPVYKRLGFIQTAGRQEKDGIIYYPMEYRI